MQINLHAYPELDLYLEVEAPIVIQPKPQSRPLFELTPAPDGRANSYFIGPDKKCATKLPQLTKEKPATHCAAPITEPTFRAVSGAPQQKSVALDGPPHGAGYCRCLGISGHHGLFVLMQGSAIAGGRWD